MILEMQCIDADEDGQRDHEYHAIACCGVFPPVRAEMCIDEDEAADEKDGIEEVEQIHIAVKSADLTDRCSNKQKKIDNVNTAYCFSIHRRNNLLYDQGTGDGHDVEHDEVDLPPDIRHPQEA